MPQQYTVTFYYLDDKTASLDIEERFIIDFMNQFEAGKTFYTDLKTNLFWFNKEKVRYVTAVRKEMFDHRENF